MMVARVLAVAGGAALVLATLLSAMKTVIVPRAEVSLPTRLLFLGLRRVFDRVASPRRPFTSRDRLMAFYAPLGLVLLPAMWVSLLLAAFTAIFWGVGLHPLATAFDAAGSSLFTLGFMHPPGTGRVALTFVAAAMGLAVVSLVISYLPSIYSAFARREVAVGMLETRAGLPPSPAELLVRYHRIGWLDRIDAELFPVWEAWFADIEESHSSQPSLVFFRSPHPERSWITAAGCVLDTAALVASTLERPHDPRADLTIRAGYLSLRRISDFFAIPYDADPRPGDPISVTRQEYDEVCDRLAAEGIALKADRDQAWHDFAGWRVNYDRVLVALCGLVMAPPAPWSTDRLTGPRHHSPARAGRRTRGSGRR